MSIVLNPHISACHLQLLLDPSVCGSGLAGHLEALLDGGVDLVQLRMKTATTPERIAAGRRLAAQLTPRGVPVLVNDDVDAATELGDLVAGVHLGQHDLPVELARAQLRPGAWVGLSTHTGAELAAGHAGSATHFGIGACFATTTKLDHRVLGHSDLAAAVASARRPLFAIGGITPENVGELVALGIRRIAVSQALLATSDPKATAAAMRRRLLDSA